MLQALSPIKLAADRVAVEYDVFDPLAFGLSDDDVAALVAAGAAVDVAAEKVTVEPAPAEPAPAKARTK